jgi:hypothetical protein
VHFTTAPIGMRVASAARAGGRPGANSIAPIRCGGIATIARSAATSPRSCRTTIVSPCSIRRTGLSRRTSSPTARRSAHRHHAAVDPRRLGAVGGAEQRVEVLAAVDVEQRV